MNLDEVQLISRHVQPIPQSEVECLESRLGIKLPPGYSPFITRFGLGVYCDLYRIYDPARILKDYSEFQESLKQWYYPSVDGKEHWFYEGSEAVLSEARAQESIIIGDSVNGDNLVFHPSQPDTIYVLPGHSEEIAALKGDFSDLHLWDSATPRQLVFVPWYDHTTLYFTSEQFTLDMPGCQEVFRARWGSDAMLPIYERSDEWSWLLVFFVPAIGGRVQVDKDEGVTRTYSDDFGNKTTIQGGGTRSLHFQIYCDEEAVPDVEAFIVSLEARGLLTIMKPEST